MPPARARPTRASLHRSWRGPGQADRRGGIRGDAFRAAKRAELLVCGRLDANAVERESRDFGDTRAHLVAARADLRRLAHDRDIEVTDDSAARFHAIDRELQELVGRSSAPLLVARGKMHANVAVGERAEDRIRECMERDVGIRMTGELAFVCDLDAAEPDVVTAAIEGVDVIADAG